MAKQVFVCVPLDGLTYNEAKDKQSEALATAGAYIQSQDELILMDSIFTSTYQYTQPTPESQADLDNRVELDHLGRALQLMASADIVVCGDGWASSRTCSIEHECAVKFGKQVIDLSAQ